MDKPKIITLCGSTRFTGAMLEEAWRLTKLENIVIHWSIRAGSADFLDETDRDIVDRLYLHKIAMADEVRIINVGGYIGDSTRSEVCHARKLGKLVTWLEPDKAD